MPKFFAIFGNPVEHSLSPIMHNSAFNKLNFDGVYKKILLKEGSKLKESFFEHNLSGANITVPHKEAAFKAADIVDDFAKEVQSVNTLVLKDNKLYGYNTDAPGFVYSIKKYGDMENILILGAGGTAKAVAPALKKENYKVTILNRSSNRLDYFKNRGFRAYSFENFNIESFDLIVNMTSAGLKDNSLPAPKELLEELFKNSKVAIDIIYGKQTPFLKLAKEFNLTTADGLDMLVGQGVLAFDYFTNHQFNLQEVEKIMKEALSIKH
jgi:shikimate dehydrogenase